MLSGLSAGSGAVRAAHAAVDDEVDHVDALRAQLARRALRQAAQRELAHGEGGREREALHAGRCAGEQDRAVLVSAAMRRAACCTTRKPPKAEISMARLTLGRRRCRRCGRAPGRWRCRRRDRASRSSRRPSSNSLATASGSEASAAKVAAPVSAASGASLSMLRAARPTLRPAAGERAGQRGADAGAGPDDQGGRIGDISHARPPLKVPLDK